MAMDLSLVVQGVQPAPPPLRVRSARVVEEISRVSEIDVEILVERPNLDTDAFLGREALLKVRLDGGGSRDYSGFVVRMTRAGTLGRFFSYGLSIRAGLWFLSRRTDCKVFQNVKVVDLIVDLMKKAYPFITVRPALSRKTYPVWEYCVQYNESDLDFVERLLQHEGIRYRLLQDGAQAVMQLEDDHTDVADADKVGVLKFAAGSGAPAPGAILVTRWQHQSSLESGRQVAAHFDELQPRQLLAARTFETSIPHGKGERFEYPGGYLKQADHKEFGERYVTDRLESHQLLRQVVHGTSNSPSLGPGRVFTLKGHPDPRQNVPHLLVSVNYDLEQVIAEGRQTLGQERMEASFTAIPAARPYRPARTTVKPRILGPQTAIVVTEKDEEITVDEHGRIKIQFHWDRLGQNDERSSCFVRVAQIWAGNGFGAMFVPRKGHEVVVSFLDGDPDRPLVTGSVYNGANKPPWGAKDTKTQSGIKTRSTKKGNAGTANHIRFEDKKGAEEFDMHAERNMSASAEVDQSLSAGHDQSSSAGHDQSMSAGHDQTLAVGNDQHVHVKKKRDTYIGNGETRVVKQDRISAIENNEVVSAKQILSFARNGWGVKAKTGTIITDSSLGMKVGGGTTLLSEGPVRMKGGKFGFVTTGNIEFACDKFNRTVGETNDIVMGAMTGTNLGPMSLTQFGGTESFVSGRASSFYAGISNSAALALQIQTVLGAAISNTLASISNVGLQSGFVGVNLGINGISLDNNNMKVFSAGGAGSSGAAAAGTLGSATGGVVAGVVAALGAGFGITAGAMAWSQQKERAAKDRKDQLDQLTPAMQRALQQAAEFDTVSDFNAHKPYTDAQLKAQLDKTGDAIFDVDAKALEASLQEPGLSIADRNRITSEIGDQRRSHQDELEAREAVQPMDPKSPDFRNQASELQNAPPPAFPTAPGAPPSGGAGR